jgi:hypothetical protein
MTPRIGSSTSLFLRMVVADWPGAPAGQPVLGCLPGGVTSRRCRGSRWPRQRAVLVTGPGRPPWSRPRPACRCGYRAVRIPSTPHHPTGRGSCGACPHRVRPRRARHRCCPRLCRAVPSWASRGAGGLFGGTIAGHRQARPGTPGHKTAGRVSGLPANGLVIYPSGVHGKEKVYGSIP